MQNEVAIEDFLNACEDIISRALSDSKDPIKLKNILQELDIFLRDKWSEAIIQLSDTKLNDHHRNQIKDIFEKIVELELISTTQLSLFDGIKEFVQRSTNQ